MPWHEPTAEQLKALLERETDMAPAEVCRVVRAFSRSRPAMRWSDLDREFARSALARRHTRRVKP